MLGKEKLIDLTLADAIDKYLDEVGSEYGRTKRYSLLLIKKLPIARNIITKIKSVHFAEQRIMVEIMVTSPEIIEQYLIKA